MTSGDNNGSGPNGPPTTPPATGSNPGAGATGDATANTRGVGTGTEETHVPVRPPDAAPGEDTGARIRALELGREMDNRQIEALGAQIAAKNVAIAQGELEIIRWHHQYYRYQKALHRYVKGMRNTLVWYKRGLQGAIVVIIVLIIALIANCNGYGGNVDTDCGPMITKKNEEISGKLARCEDMLERVRSGFRASAAQLEAAKSKTGDPFTAEAVIGDPRRQLTAEELDKLCHSSDAGVIAVKKQAAAKPPAAVQEKKKKKKKAEGRDPLDTPFDNLDRGRGEPPPIGPTGPTGPAGPPGPTGRVIVIPGGTPPVDPPSPPPSPSPAAVINVNIAEREAYQKCASLKDREVCCERAVDEVIKDMTARDRRKVSGEKFRLCTGLPPLILKNTSH